MKAKELAARLMKNPEQEVMILDGFNGGGTPRTINFGPIHYTICKEDSENAGDCEYKIGQKVIIIGYGCY